MSQMKLVFATASTMVQVARGNNVQILQGDVWRASDPVVRAHRDLFTDDPRSVLKTSVPYDESDDDASYADAPSRDELTQHLEAERARNGELEAELAEYRTAAEPANDESKEQDVSNEDLAKAPPVDGYRTEAEAARARAESENGVSVEVPVEGYRTTAEAARAEAESEDGVSKPVPVDGYRTQAEAARAKGESEEDVVSAEAEAPVEQATRAPGEKRTTRRTGTSGK
jgi:hypothetical protein